MPISNLCCESFISSLARWAICAESTDPSAMTEAARNVRYAGELIVLYSEFAKQIDRHCPGLRPDQALNHMISFLQAYSEMACSERTCVNQQLFPESL